MRRPMLENKVNARCLATVAPCLLASGVLFGCSSSSDSQPLEPFAVLENTINTVTYAGSSLFCSVRSGSTEGSIQRVAADGTPSLFAMGEPAQKFVTDGTN